MKRGGCGKAINNRGTRCSHFACHYDVRTKEARLCEGGLSIRMNRCVCVCADTRVRAKNQCTDEKWMAAAWKGKEPKRMGTHGRAHRHLRRQRPLAAHLPLLPKVFTRTHSPPRRERKDKGEGKTGTHLRAIHAGPPCALFRSLRRWCIKADALVVVLAADVSRTLACGRLRHGWGGDEM